MAFNWQVFRVRALSSVVFVVVMAAGLLWSEWSFLALFSVVHFGCWWEYYKLVNKINGTPHRGAVAFFCGAALAGWCGMLLLAGDSWNGSTVSPQLVGWRLLYLAVPLLAGAVIFGYKKLKRQVAFSLLAGLLYISLPLALLVGLRTAFFPPDAAYALSIPLLIIVTNWINDTMAYIVGSLIGKTPLSSISPKKTWEGTIGGALLAVLTISAIAYFGRLLPVGHAAALAALGAISGTYGDLAESKLKRMAGVKDSGTMMPGHGGFLDRFDSLLFSATVGVVYVALAM